MRATIVNNQDIWLSNISPYEEEAVEKATSVAVTNRYVNPLQYRAWDGVYRAYNKRLKRLPRQMLRFLEEVCIKKDLPLEIADEREPSQFRPIDPATIGDDFLAGIKLDPHQLRAIRATCEEECGIIAIKMGGGKGECIAGTCKAIPCPTIILSDQTVVVDQLKARLQLRDVAQEVGFFYAGKRPNGEPIIIGSIQSLTATKEPDAVKRKPGEKEATWDARWDRYLLRLKAYQTRCRNLKILTAYVRRAEMILVDECDKAVSNGFKNLFRYHFKGRRVYGFSGTPFDPEKPIEAMVVRKHFGSIIAEADRQELEAAGRIIPVEGVVLALDFGSTIHDASAYDIAYTEFITANPDFHQIVTGICRKHRGESTLVLVDRVELGNELEKILLTWGMHARFIHGETPKPQRRAALKDFEQKKLEVLIGGKIINRGLDLNGGCHNLVIATVGKLSSELEQKVGRAVRQNDKGKGRVYAFMLRCNKYLYSHSRKQLRALVNMGYDVSVVFPGGRVDGRKLIESRFRVSPRLLARHSA